VSAASSARRQSAEKGVSLSEAVSHAADHVTRRVLRDELNVSGIAHTLGGDRVAGSKLEGLHWVSPFVCLVRQ
jgi:hypothetical protein